MILNRLASAFRDKNFSVVLIELLVIVVGIFLGFQLDGWNEDRKDRALELQYLERSRADAQFNLEAVRLRGNDIADRAARILKVASAIELGVIDSIDEADKERTFCYWYVIEAVPQRSAAYDELVATGNISLISDIRLREALQLTAATSQQTTIDSNLLNPILAEIARSLRPYVRWHTTDQATPENRIYPGALCTADLYEMVGDADAVSALVQLYRGQSIMANGRMQDAEQLEQLIAELDRVLAAR